MDLHQQQGVVVKHLACAEPLPDKTCLSQNSADCFSLREVELILELWGTNSALVKPGQCKKLLD